MVMPPTVSLELIWQMACFLQNQDNLRLNRSGNLQSIYAGNDSLPAIVHMKPLIDLNSNNESFIYSLLAFVCVSMQSSRMLLQALHLISLSDSKPILYCRIGFEPDRTDRQSVSTQAIESVATSVDTDCLSVCLCQR